MSIVSDSREPDNNFTREELDCGDYVITGPDDGIIIERKEFTDLVSSMRSGKLYQQLRMCREQEDYRTVLLVEGSRSNAIRYANSTHYEMRRLLTSLLATAPDIQMMFSQSYQETIGIVKDLDEWIGDDKKREHRIREAEKVPAGERPRYIVEGLDSIGPSTAKKLLDHFGDVRSIMTAGRDELQEVSGIGPKTADKIVAHVTQDY